MIGALLFMCFPVVRGFEPKSATIMAMAEFPEIQKQKMAKFEFLRGVRLPLV